MQKIKLISVNIEGSKHLNKVLPFLKLENPDVICLQELIESDIPAFIEIFGPEYIYAPMFPRIKNDREEILGVGVFSRLPSIEKNITYYVDHRSPLQRFDPSTVDTKFKTASFALAGITVKLDGKDCTLFSTHFPVTDDGHATDFQRETLAKLFTVLKEQNSFILCGDFNAPRGREIFTLLAEKYMDNVPTQYTSSIDGTIHRAGQLPYMVDGLFSTQNMRVENVEMRCGVSDHCALISDVYVG